jgi:hypothetical protein
MGQGSGHLEYPDQHNDMRYKKNTQKFDQPKLIWMKEVEEGMNA